MYGNPSSTRALHKTCDYDAYFRSEGFDTIGFEESVWRRPADAKLDMLKIFLPQLMWMIVLLLVNLQL